MSIYTKTGDKGSTALVGGSRVSKADLRVDTYGTVDELNAALSLAERATLGADNRALLEAVEDRAAAVVGHDHAQARPRLRRRADERAEVVLGREVADTLGVQVSRETNVLDLIKRMRDMLAAGYGSKEIAKELNRHLSTITHRSQRIRYKQQPPKDGLTPPRTIVNASVRGTLTGGDWIPARMISEKYAASKAVKVMMAEISAPIGRPMSMGTSRKNHKITITSGMERMPLT